VKTDGMFTWKMRKARLQLYWPELTLSKAEVFVGIDTVARFVNKPAQYYYGAGVKVLGFGIGFDYFDPPPTPTVGAPHET
jgi:hypothetical protein